MKRIFITVALAGTMIAAGIPGVAQTATDSQNTTTQQAQTEGHHHHHHHRLAYMTKKLNLTQDQQSQLKPIFQKQHQQAKTIWQDSSLSKEQKHEKMQVLRQETIAQVNPILTPEQQQQWQRMREQAKTRHQKNNEAQPTTATPQG